MTAMRASLRRYWAEAHPYQRFLYGAAALFAASTVLHAVVFVVDDRAWSARASWRQPLAFSLAFVLVLSSLAWAMTFLPKRRKLGWAVSGTLGVAAVATVFLIALQAWRDQPAFFPEDHTFDQAVWTGIQIGIGFIVAPIVVEAIWAWTRVDAPTSLRWAIRAGLVLVVAGLAMGVVMVVEGVTQDIDNPAAGQVESPVVFGDDGLVLFPHLLCLHAVLVLGFLAWVLSFTAWPEHRRTVVVQVALAGYVVLIATRLAQALAGRAPLELVAPAALVFWTSVAVVAAAFAATAARLGATARSPRA